MSVQFINITIITILIFIIVIMFMDIASRNNKKLRILDKQFKVYHDSMHAKAILQNSNATRTSAKQNRNISSKITQNKNSQQTKTTSNHNQQIKTNQNNNKPTQNSTTNNVVQWKPNNFTFSAYIITGFSNSGLTKAKLHTQLRIPRKSPNGTVITKIANNAFANQQLTDVIIPASITVIGKKAFAYNKLTHITIPSTTVVADDAFVGNESLTITVSEPTTNKSGKNTFSNNKK